MSNDHTTYSIQMAFSYVAVQILPTLLPKLDDSSPKVMAIAQSLFGCKRYINNYYAYIFMNKAFMTYRPPKAGEGM